MKRRDFDPTTPPPFPGRQRRGYGSRMGGGSRNWEYEWLGKHPNQSWGEYLGLSPARSRRFYRDHEGTGDGTSLDGEEMMENYGRSPNPHRLYRSRTDVKLGGVCAGIADYMNIDSWIVRLGFIIGFFAFTPVFLFGYPIMWWILKQQPMGLYESREEEVFWRSVATKPDQTLSALRAKFRDLDREIGSMEGYVASREYDLHRQFKDLESK